MNYFSVIDQNNQRNCLLHYYFCFTFEFLRSAVMISYQNSSSQCMNFRRRGLVSKSVAILFSLECKNHPVLEIQTQQCPRKLNWIIKKIVLYICVAGLTSKTPIGRDNCSLIAMILSNFPRNVSYCYCCYQQRLQRRIAIMTKRSKWNNSLGKLSIIIH